MQYIMCINIIIRPQNKVVPLVLARTNMYLLVILYVIDNLLITSFVDAFNYPLILFTHMFY